MTEKPDEFEIIAAHFAPLANSSGAFDLTDDCAILEPAEGDGLVVTSDTIVAGVHFLSDDPPETVAVKLLGVNCSDLASMGAVPLAYTLAAAWSEPIDEAWIGRFAKALRTVQDGYGMGLIGGDTVATPGPTTLNATAFGTVEKGTELRRNGAQPGDTVYVSGTIGDAVLGLMHLRGRIDGIDDVDAEFLTERYRSPRARTELGRSLLGLADAAIDVSDGLIADIAHLASASGVAAVLEADRVPLSPASRAVVRNSPDLLPTLVTGGDDYELVFSAPASAEEALQALAARLDCPIAAIGVIVEYRAGDRRVRLLDGDGNDIDVAASGYRHF